MYKVKHVPEWFPGSGFKRFAKETRAMFDVAVKGPLEYVKESLKVYLCDYFILALIVASSPTTAMSLSRLHASITWTNCRIKDLTRVTFGW